MSACNFGNSALPVYPELLLCQIGDVCDNSSERWKNVCQGGKEKFRAQREKKQVKRTENNRDLIEISRKT